MKRSSLACAAVAAAAVAAAAVPTAASAQEIELGQIAGAPLVAPLCPTGVSQADCTIVLPQVTALETIRDGVDYPTKVRKPGEIVAFTLGLSALSTSAATVKSDIAYLDSTYGGAASAELTVLRPVGPASRRVWTVAAESPAYALQPYLGQVVQFPLSQALPVVPGEVLALTAPTWAPVLSFDLAPKEYAYRQSRKADCTHTVTSLQAQLAIGNAAPYDCDYAGTRVEYTATEVTTPAPNAAVVTKQRSRVIRRRRRA
jgi:hypothetical protein